MSWFVSKPKPIEVWETFAAKKPAVWPYPILVTCPAAKDESERAIIEEWSCVDIARFSDQPHGWTHWRIKDIDA